MLRPIYSTTKLGFQIEFLVDSMETTTLAIHRMRRFSAKFVCCLLVVTGVAMGEWQNSLKPIGQLSREVVLAQPRKPARPIRLTPNATAIEKNAAAELQHWIEQITTARPDVTTTDTGPSVRLTTDAALGEEGYRIAVEGDDLVLAGGTGRGVINAVYALLEEDLGCRFYANDSIRLPKGTTLSVRPVARTFVPTLRLRDPFYATAFNEPWSLRNRTNAPHAVVREEYGGSR
jgi:hypothetical protein